MPCMFSSVRLVIPSLEKPNELRYDLLIERTSYFLLQSSESNRLLLLSFCCGKTPLQQVIKVLLNKLCNESVLVLYQWCEYCKQAVDRQKEHICWDFSARVA